MLKRITSIFAVLVMFTMVAHAQWTNQGAWPDTSYKGGTHGIAVDPDGKVWQSSYYSETWVSPDGDSISTSPIYVFEADGSLNDILYFVTDGTVTDTLSGSNRGMGVDNEGNIVYVQSGPGKAVKINYQTKARMASALLPEIGSSPTAPSVDENGNIYIGPVVGGGTTAIAVYDPELNFLENAVVGPPAISRTMEVSADGNTIYWTPFTALKSYVYTRADEFSPFELTDSIHAGMSIESTAWQPGTGLLWVSNDARATDTTKSPNTWYGYDTETGTFVDSFSLPVTGLADEYPRGIDFSPDGSIAYVGLFGSAFPRIFKFTTTTGVEEVTGVVVEDYSLEQNYPNPFNPTTTISFAIPEAGMVTLKVYDMLGQEVATLVNEELAQGQFNVNFDASNLSSGTYIYQLNTQGATIAKKMMLLK